MRKDIKYIRPIAEIVTFNNDDIILTSGNIGEITYPWQNDNGDYPLIPEEI